MDFSVISRREVVQGVKDAVSPKKQIKIYSQLCLCSAKDIEEIIKEDTMGNRWTEDDVKLLIKLIADGESYEQISVTLVRSKSAVQQKVEDLKAKGIIPDVNKSKMNLSSSDPEASVETQMRVLRAENKELKERCELLLQELSSSVIITLQEQHKLCCFLDIIEIAANSIVPNAGDKILNAVAGIKLIVEKNLKEEGK